MKTDVETQNVNCMLTHHNSDQVKVKNSHLEQGHSEDWYRFLNEHQIPGSETGEKSIIKPK